MILTAVTGPHDLLILDRIFCCLLHRLFAMHFLHLTGDLHVCRQALKFAMPNTSL